MSNHDLERNVTDELHWEPMVDSATIAVKADGGKITLRGTVGSFGAKRQAKKTAERVHGVTSVHNELEVQLLTESRREDADVRADVLQALMLNSLVPDTIDARVKEGEVTLTGTAQEQYQREEAERSAGNVYSVVALHDDIELVPRDPSAVDVKQSIRKALERHARIDADQLSIKTHDGTVIVSGVVSSWAEHDSALAAAWAAPGVSRVTDDIAVEY